MDKRALAVVAVIAVVVGGGIVYSVAGSSSDDGETVTAATPTQTEPTSNENAGNGGSSNAKDNGNKANAAAPGQFVEYSPDAVASTSGTKLLFFYAPWCSQCRALEDDINANTIPDGVTIFKVDYDTNQDLRQKYGVTIQTTMVQVDDDGNKVDLYVAYDDPTLETVEQALSL